MKRYGDGEVSQFNSAEMIAEKWDISRDDMEAFAVESHERAIRARAEGRFERRDRAARRRRPHDEGPREPNWEKIRSLPHARRGRPGHRRGRVADLRRVGRAARRAARQALQGPTASRRGPASTT